MKLYSLDFYQPFRFVKNHSGLSDYTNRQAMDQIWPISHSLKSLTCNHGSQFCLPIESPKALTPNFNIAGLMSRPKPIKSQSLGDTSISHF